MREGSFIKKNKDRWESLRSGGSADPDELAKEFIEITDDLSYAKTFYPTSKVTQYLNGIASSIYLRIYQNKKEERSVLLHFWKTSLPLTIYRYRRIILFCLLAFLLFYIIGFFTAYQDPGFTRQTLGDRYVDMTERNIESGNPFGVYQSGTPFFNWIGIMINNIIVSFSYFLKGIILGIFSVTSMLKESMRIGSFHYMFFSKGFGGAFILAVMIHGLLELPAIVLASSAGVVLGMSYVFPGTYSRLTSFRRGVKDGAKIVIGIMPVLIVAAFLEGFVTRHYQMPLMVNISLLLASSVFMVWYFILYPLQVFNSQKNA